ncbi:hypothetical protein BBJ28_00017813 [Nothophytophthora sp. Chile5]|nr:hypothetical protein BBJ28_00017813 [Nothophytophthora sp. Chile5]
MNNGASGDSRHLSSASSRRVAATARVGCPERLLTPLTLAFTTVNHILRNSSLCVAVGWLFGYCFTLGNFFSGHPPGQQSYAAFGASIGAWFHGVFSACVIMLMAMKLLPEQFVGVAGAPTDQVATVGQKLTIFQCTAKLLRRMTWHLVFSSIAVVGGDYAMYMVLPEEGHQYKPGLYVSAFWGYYILVRADVIVRQIFRTETVRGLARSAVKASQREPRQLGDQPAGRTTPGLIIQARARKRRKHRRPWMASLRQFLHVYIQNLPVVLSSLVAVIYVHVISQCVSFTGQWELLALASGSLALKLAMQELVKRHLMAARRLVPKRVMIALVSTPTILVDTQVRMLLLRLQNVKLSVLSTVLLGISEIAVRSIRATIMQRYAHSPSVVGAPHGLIPERRVRALVVAPVTRSPSARQMTMFQLQVHPWDESAQSLARIETEARERKIHALHAIEIYADMYAEFIAIGCSYAILFFYWNHPQFQFASLLKADTSGASRGQQLLPLGGLQLGVEVLVDYIACSIEAAQGVEFASFDQNDPFLVFFLTILSFSNVAISAGLYIR